MSPWDAYIPDELKCTEDEILHLLLSLDVVKHGSDGISGMMLREAASCITPTVTRLLNLFLLSRMLEWKIC